MTRSLNVLIALAVTLTVAANTLPCQAELVADFESLSPDQKYGGAGGGSFWNGKDGAGGFADGGASFTNAYNTSWDSWSGWAYSNTLDTLTSGYENQYSAYTLRGAGYQEKFGTNYGVAFPGDAKSAITLSGAPIGMHVTNTTYAALSMLDGDAFAKKFGGDTGDDPDWFMLQITGTNTAGAETGTVDFYLADYRSADDYVINEWTWIDLTGFGDDTRKLEFALSSSDVGSWGMNTPGFFAMDNLTTVPEPSTLALFGIALTLGIGGYSVRQRRSQAAQGE